MEVDDGESVDDMRYKATPILVADGSFDAPRVAGLFMADSKHLPADVVDFVNIKLREYRSPGDRTRR